MLAEFHQYSPWVRRGSFSHAGLMPVLLGACLLVVGGLLFGNALLIQSKAVLAQLLLERAWTETLRTGKATKAWSWADTHPIARLTFPSLNRSAIVLAEGGGEALAFGPAHVGASPRPGEPGTSVIGGHRDTHFDFLKYLRVGEEVILERGNKSLLQYRVTGSVIVDPKASGISTLGSRSHLALVTCYPFDSVTQSPLRYVVFAEQVRARSVASH